MNSVLLKAVAACAVAPLSLDPARRMLETRLASTSRFRLIALFATSRVSICLAAFAIVQVKLPSDVAHYYADFGHAALASGRTPGSPYSPGFDYLMAALLWLFHSPASIVGLMTVVEIVAFGVTLTALWSADRPLSLSVAALWLVCPISLFNVALGGQDEALILLATASALWAITKKRDALAGACVACGLMVSKILAVFAAIPLLCVPARGLARGAVTAIALIAVAVVVMLAAHVPLLGFFDEARNITSGNVWAVMALLLNRDLLFSTFWMLGITAAILGLAVVAMRRRPLEDAARQVLRAMGTVGCLFLLFSPKAFASYLVMFLPGILFLLLSVPRWVRAPLVLAFLPVSVFESSLWFSLVPYGQSLHTNAGGRMSLGVADAVLVTGYAILAWRGLTLGFEPALAAPRTGRT
jgi:hypothetical protein